MPGLDWLTARPVAHRGLHDAESGVIENTASAFSAAVAGNYAIECDLQIAADGEAVVFHDDTLDRLTQQQGAVAARTAAELKAVPFKASGDRIISLGELCDLVAGRVTLVLELKSHFDGDRRLPRRVAEVLQNYAGPVAAMSFDPAMVAALRDFAAGLPRGLVGQSDLVAESGGTQSRSAYLMAALRSRPHFLAWSVRDLPAVLPLVARHVFGLSLLTWTVRSEADRKRARRFANQMIFEGFRP